MINVIFGIRTPTTLWSGLFSQKPFFWVLCDSQLAGLIKTLKFGLLSGDRSVLKLHPITRVSAKGSPANTGA